MIYTVWQSLPRFLVVSMMKGALGRGLKMQEIPRTSYYRLAGLGRDRGFRCRDRALWFFVTKWVLCHDRIWSWQGVLGSRPWLLPVVTMS